jgi:hypothetical protein
MEALTCYGKVIYLRPDHIVAVKRMNRLLNQNFGSLCINKSQPGGQPDNERLPEMEHTLFAVPNSLMLADFISN